MISRIIRVEVWKAKADNNTKSANLTCLPLTLSVLRHDNCIICSYDVTGADFQNSLNAFEQPEKS